MVGHGIGAAADGGPVIEVYLRRANVERRAQLPAELEGVPVEVSVTGRFVAY